MDFAAIMSPLHGPVPFGATRRIGSWNHRLFRAACDLNARGVPSAKAEKLLLQGAKPKTSDDDQAARDTIASAYSQPAAEPLLRNTAGAPSPSQPNAPGCPSSQPDLHLDAPPVNRFCTWIPFQSTGNAPGSQRNLSLSRGICHFFAPTAFTAHHSIHCGVCWARVLRRQHPTTTKKRQGVEVTKTKQSHGRRPIGPARGPANGGVGFAACRRRPKLGATGRRLGGQPSLLAATTGRANGCTASACPTCPAGFGYKSGFIG